MRVGRTGWSGEIHRLLIDLEELEDEAPKEKVKSNRERMLDFYVPRGLRDIHSFPIPRL